MNREQHTHTHKTKIVRLQALLQRTEKNVV